MDKELYNKWQQMVAGEIKAMHPREVREVLNYVKENHIDETILSKDKVDILSFIKKEKSHEK